MISFLITVCNEHEELARVLEQLDENTFSEEEIIILYDEPKVTEEVLEVINRFKSIFRGRKYEVICGKLSTSFSEYKNSGVSRCTQPWIFQVDADETFSPILLERLRTIIEENDTADLFYIPRINTVLGITRNHLKEWGWEGISKSEMVTSILTPDQYEVHPEYVDLLKELGYVITEMQSYSGGIYLNYYEPILNFPDYQSRLYRNNGVIHWEGAVHERLVGATNPIALPAEYAYCLLHFKEIKRQENQNRFYVSF